MSAVLGDNITMVNALEAGKKIGTNDILANGVLFGLGGAYVIFFLKLVRKLGRPK